MGLPLGDWQFWTVTACALGAVWMLVKPLFGSGSGPTGPCSSCPSARRSPAAGDRSETLVQIGSSRQ